MATAASPYAVTKLAHHADRLATFKRGELPSAPILIHLMPQNHCNHDCTWCSYRLSNWKNSQLFDESQHVPWALLEKTLREAREMGTKAVELTGGGEPFLYPSIDRLLDLIDELGFDLGMVSNGTAVTAARASRIGSMVNWKWGRISIDAGKEETYRLTRSIGEFHWQRAWNAVRKLSEERDRRRPSEIRVGVGFVTDNENAAEVYDFCKLAKDAGADNVRLSLRFGPGGNDYYLPGKLDTAEALARKAVEELNDERFLVVNLIPERRANQDAGTQDYHPCYSMQLICVIGGDSKVYTCCTLAFSPEGVIGDLREKSFREVWSDEFFRKFNVRETCKVACLYEKRNKAMIAMVDGTAPPPALTPPPHVNFV